MTVGASKPEHEVYGFHRGYFVSPHHAAETIRGFVAYFFSCDVCRTNFLRMYDGCGHKHCNRLGSEIVIGLADGDSTRTDLALWLWEVHNSVNARLMREAAQRQNRNVTLEETLASQFPTRKMCPLCWRDENMTQWDESRVFQFLDAWYWPNREPVNEKFTTVISENDIVEREMPKGDHSSVRSDATTFSTVPLFRMGTAFAFLLCFVAIFLLAVITVLKTRKGRRKKFVDSRFVKKKKGCF